MAPTRRWTALGLAAVVIVGSIIDMSPASAWASRPAASSAAAVAVTATSPAPSRVNVTSLTSGYAVSWAPGGATGVTSYQISRIDAQGRTSIVATVPAGAATVYRDETAVLGAAYEYVVSVVYTVDGATRTAASAPAKAPAQGAVTKEILATRQCPATTVSVSTTSQLSAALLAAKAGDVITLAPGTYTGQFKLRGLNGGVKRTWICGPSSAVLTTGSRAEGSALMLTNDSNIVVRGLSFRGSQKGVTVITGTNITLRDITVTDVGYEAVHFRTQTVDSWVIGSRMTGAGKIVAKYGEGVYVGTSSGNVCAQNGCEPDRTVNVNVIDNEISETGAQPIEAKEGTLSGVISGNRVYGATWMDPYSQGLILVKGSGWKVLNNSAVVVSGFGLGVIYSEDGSGNDNVFGGNFVAGTPTYGLWVNNASWPTRGPTFYCSNSTIPPVPLANRACVR